MQRRRIELALLALCLALGTPQRALGDQPSAAPEYEIKAAFVYNLTKFVEWPAEPPTSDGNPIVLGVLGPNPFGDALERAVAGKTIAGRRIDVRYFSRGERITKVHLLFVTEAAKDDLRALPPQVTQAPVLLVSDMPGFLQRGGMVMLFTDQNRIKFSVNLDTTQRARLALSAKLLQLAVPSP